MTPQELETRLKKYAYRIVTLTEALPNSVVAKIMKGQIIRAAFSAAANYRSACNGYTKKAFAAKLAIAFEEIDESLFWIEVIRDLGLVNRNKLSLLLKEADELTRILASSRITLEKKQGK